MEEVAAFVLAGGRSSRMGADKAALDFNGQTLLSRAVELARSVAPAVQVVGNPKRLSVEPAPSLAIVEDIFPGCGPLGGIHAALSARSAELNLMLAVDMPFLRQEFLLFMLQRARESGATVTVPRAGGGLQPLSAVYRSRFLPRAAEALAAGRNKVDALFTPADTLVLEEEELARLSFPAAMFDNLNTREEYERARNLPGEWNGTSKF
jgi:molybdopterin-guanine dinucleotide biosynthesis protein A